RSKHTIAWSRRRTVERASVPSTKSESQPTRDSSEERAMDEHAEIHSTGLTRQLADQARTLSFSDIPEDIREWARHCLLDYIACGIAGASDELPRSLVDELREQGGTPVATLFGSAERLPVTSAAIINGAASHALDYDDVNLAMPGHPSVAIL